MPVISSVKVTSSPHMHGEDTTRQIMLDVLIALLPALAISVFVFGARSLVLTVVTVLASVFFEYMYQKLMHLPITANDGSAAVTGMLLAFCLPVSAPLWMALIGSFFGIVIVKQLYGGIGKNFMNPALAARAFLLSWPALMTIWPKIQTSLPLFTTPVDVVTSATPLAQLKMGMLPDASILDMALGMIPGSLGEVSTLALIVGGLYLLYRRVISPIIPLSFIGTVALITFAFPMAGLPAFEFMMSHLLSGGLMLGAIFMATDYTTSPITLRGQVIYGIGCGALTILIRYFGSYPEGVSYAILLMNASVFLIEKMSRRRVFGHNLKLKKTEEGAK